MGGNKTVCKYEMALKTMQQNRNAAAEAAGNKGNNPKRIAGSVSHEAQRMNVDEKKRRGRRREEKAENLFQLIYWGPN